MSDPTAYDELLLGRAFGKLSAPEALAVDTHLALSPAARRRYAAYRELGGLFLDELEPARLSPGAWQRLEEALQRHEPRPPSPPKPIDRRVPAPLRRFVPHGFEALPWRNLGPALEYRLPCEVPGYRVSLLRVRAGKSIPVHTHKGRELTVVIEGGFRDEFGRYERGDLVIADAEVEHRPVVDEDEDCLCLTVLDAPLELTGPLGRWLNPLLRI